MKIYTCCDTPQVNACDICDCCGTDHAPDTKFHTDGANPPAWFGDVVAAMNMEAPRTGPNAKEPDWNKVGALWQKGCRHEMDKLKPKGKKNA